MGNYLQTDQTWYVYRRVLSTDEWSSAPLQVWSGIEQDVALARFKHEAYAFALSKHVDYEDTKSIYLYQGSTRMAKVHFDVQTCQVEIWSSSIREWLACEEKLAKSRYPLLLSAFHQKYYKKYAWVNTQTVTFLRI